MFGSVFVIYSGNLVQGIQYYTGNLEFMGALLSIPSV